VSIIFNALQQRAAADQAVRGEMRDLIARGQRWAG
jgi:hypothetical protein